VHDQAFEKSFTDIYTAKSLQKPWYLGNWSSMFFHHLPLVITIWHERWRNLCELLRLHYPFQF
jgi:hypothetical protein